MSPESSPSKIGKSVGEKIRVARVALHYTQSKLAAPDFSVSYISAIERGQIHPSLRALEILAGRLGLSTTELLPKRPLHDEQQAGTPRRPEREDDDGEMLLLEVQLRLSQNEAGKAIALLTKTSAKRLKRPQQLWHRYLLGRAHFQAGHFQEAEHIFSELVQMVKDGNNHYLHARILSLLGDTFAAMHNPNQALLAHQRCLNVLEAVEARDAFLIATVFMRLGSHHIELDRYEEALLLFQKALATIQEHDSAAKVYTLYNALIHFATDTQDYQASAIYAYRSLVRSAQENQLLLKGELYHYLGQAIIKGDQQEAFVHLKALEEKECSHQLLKASITTRIAEWHFLQQQLPEAHQLAQEACLLAQPFGDTIITADALLLLGHIEYVQQAFANGDTHFVEGLAILERLKRQVEHIEYSIQYAQLLEANGKEREAFAYFRSAYQNRI